MVGDWGAEHGAQPRTGDRTSLSRAPVPTGVSGPMAGPSQVPGRVCGVE
jgi:hypothetical protein